MIQSSRNLEIAGLSHDAAAPFLLVKTGRKCGRVVVRCNAGHEALYDKER